jgi:cytosine/adenosine deaminase-related metal-dependent hydrolase
MGRSAEEIASTLIRNAVVVTMNDGFDVVHGDVSVRGGRIAAVGRIGDGVHDAVIDAAGALLLPGFIQTHIHLCQTLFRGYADDLRLLAWLQTRIWPMEAAHTPASLRAATRLACHELLTSGTTTVLTMETVHDTDAVLDAAIETGIRATIGKCLMDAPPPGAPPRLREDARRGIDESLALHRRYHGAANGRIRTALAPRFAVSCSRDLLETVAALSERDDVLVHTHASEQRDEVDIVRRETGLSNVDYLDAVGLASPRLCAAHCVWVDEHEQDTLRARDVKVTHCPGSNLKLGSGIAPVPELLARGICVSLGADGAACNNHLDMFGEMRLAATLQAIRREPGALTARDVLWMATRGGARALGLGAEIGSIEVGKRADLILVDTRAAAVAPSPDPFSAVVYGARPDSVLLTMVDGDVLVRGGVAQQLDARAIAADAFAEAAALARRAGL